MEDALLKYYEQELTYVREMGQEFARKYPKIAGRLLLEKDRAADLHVERMIEAFAFLSGRIHKKIDDDFPEITQSLLNIIYPHYVAPIPSMTVAQFAPIKQNIAEGGYELCAKTALFSHPVDGTRCSFRTCTPVHIWPVEVIDAAFREPDHSRDDEALLYLNIELASFNNIPVSEILWERLRFFLNGQSHYMYRLHELLLNNAIGIELEGVNERGKREVVQLGPDAIRPVGFEDDEALMPFTSRSFPGYRLLLEYFCMPEKFLFFDLRGLERLRHLHWQSALTLRIFLNKLPKTKIGIDRQTFVLNAAPVVNLFSRIAEPIRIEHTRPEYRVIPDVRRQEVMEIFSLDRVSSANESGTVETVEVKPFYSIRHHLAEAENLKRQVFWHANRRPSGKKGDHGTEMFLSFVDLGFAPTDPDAEILTAHVTCTNRDLPARLPFGNSNGDFDLEQAAPVAAITCLMKPSASRRPELGGGLQWRLISHLSLNYMSIVQGGVDALKEILRLYDYENSSTTQQQINGIVAIGAQHVTRRLGQSFCRGVLVTVELDEEKFIGAGLYLFASILERFLAQYVSVNSFSQLVVKTVQGKEVLKQWPPRSGDRVLL